MPSTKDSSTTDHQPGEDPLAQQVRGLIADGQAMIETELAFQKQRVAFGLGQAKTIAVFLVVALVLAFFAVMALIVGLLLALTPVLGPWGALGAVVLGICAVVGLCVIVALRAIGKVRAVLMGKPTAPEETA